MNVYKITFAYAAPNGFQRSANLIIEAPDESAARVAALRAINANCKYPSITRVKLYAHQGDLEVTTDQPKRGK